MIDIYKEMMKPENMGKPMEFRLSVSHLDLLPGTKPHIIQRPDGSEVEIVKLTDLKDEVKMRINALIVGIMHSPKRGKDSLIYYEVLNDPPGIKLSIPFGDAFTQEIIFGIVAED